MSVTQKELIDYCNVLDGQCSLLCRYDNAECEAFAAKYGTTPYLNDEKRPELYSDDVIEVEPNMALEESDNEIPFGNASFSELDSIINAYEIHGNHKKVVELLKELRERRKQPEIIRCGNCRFNIPLGDLIFCKKWSRYTVHTGYCHQGAESRTDGQNKIHDNF